MAAAVEKRRILIVGGGLSGGAIFNLLQQCAKKASYDIHLWEKNDVLGGRLYTHEFAIPSSSGNAAMVDLGAQYISRKSHQQSMMVYDYYRPLLDSRVLVPWHDVIENENPSEKHVLRYVAPKGMRSIVEYLLKDCSYLSVNRSLSSLTFNNKRWSAVDQEGSIEEFDSVIITIPICQERILQFKKLDCITSEMLTAASPGETASKRFAVGMLVKKDCRNSTSWTCKYVNDSPVIRFVSFDSQKRQQNEPCDSFAIHTSVPFSINNWHQTNEEVLDIVQQELERLFPDVAENAFDATLVRWNPSQVRKPEVSNTNLFYQSHRDTLFFAGESFTGSGFDNVWSSANDLVSKLF